MDDKVSINTVCTFNLLTLPLISERVMSQNVNSSPHDFMVTSYVCRMCGLVSADNMSLESWSGYMEHVEVNETTYHPFQSHYGKVSVFLIRSPSLPLEVNYNLVSGLTEMMIPPRVLLANRHGLMSDNICRKLHHLFLLIKQSLTNLSLLERRAVMILPVYKFNFTLMVYPVR